MDVRSRLVGSAAYVTVLTIALSLSVSACASSDSEQAAEPTTTAAGASALTTAPTASTAPTDVTVDVRDMAFSPATVTIAAGQTVTWNFDDGGIPHAVQGLRDVGMEINSPIAKAGEWSHTFAVPGTYDYICPLHPEMRGTVIVE